VEIPLTISSGKEYDSLAAAIADTRSEVRTIEISDIHVVTSNLSVPVRQRAIDPNHPMEAIIMVPSTI
jgi:hypothetical protein